MPQYKLYYFHSRILQNSRFVKILYGIVAETPVCMRQNNSYEPSAYMDLIKCHGEFFGLVLVFKSCGVNANPTDKTMKCVLKLLPLGQKCRSRD